MSNNNPQTSAVQEPFSWRDIHSLKFVTQFAFSFMILGFCIFQLTNGDRNAKNEPLYWSYLTGIVAWWMPSPAIARNRPPRMTESETSQGSSDNPSS
jgi:hypothetical protein